MTWNWGAASGMSNGRTMGLQLGGKWTAGTGSTENALSVDGRLTKYGDELDWEYLAQGDFPRQWRIRRERLDLTFVPFYDKVTRTNLGHRLLAHRPVLRLVVGRVQDGRGREGGFRRDRRMGGRCPEPVVSRVGVECHSRWDDGAHV